MSPLSTMSLLSHTKSKSCHKLARSTLSTPQQLHKYTRILSHHFHTSPQLHDALSMKNAASGILPDEYFQQEIFKSHNARKLQQLGADTVAMRREVFLDAIEKDLRMHAAEKHIEQLETLLKEYIPVRGVSSYGLLHAMRCFRDVGTPEKGWGYLLDIEEMGAPPALNNLSIVAEIVKTAMATREDTNFVWAVSVYATRFLDDPVLWLQIFDHANQIGSPHVDEVVYSLLWRYYPQFAKNNAWKHEVVKFFNRCKYRALSYAVTRTIETRSEYAHDRDIFYSMMDRVLVDDDAQALKVFQFGFKSWKRLVGTKDEFPLHRNTVTLAVQCCIRTHQWAEARFYLQYFFPEIYGQSPSGRTPQKPIGSAQDDALLTVLGIQVFTHFNEFSTATAAFKLCTETPQTVDALMRLLLKARKYAEVAAIYRKYFKPFQQNGFVPHMRHTGVLVQAFMHEQNPHHDDSVLYLYDALYNEEMQGTMLQSEVTGEAAASFLSYFLSRPDNEEMETRAVRILRMVLESLATHQYHRSVVLYEPLTKELLPRFVKFVGAHRKDVSQRVLPLQYLTMQIHIRTGDFDSIIAVLDAISEKRKADGYVHLLKSCEENLQIHPESLDSLAMGVLKVAQRYPLPIKAVVPFMQLLSQSSVIQGDEIMRHVMARRTDLSRLDLRSRDELLRLLKKIETKVNSEHVRSRIRSMRIALNMYNESERRANLVDTVNQKLILKNVLN